MKVLVTGALGFVGINVVREVAEAGHRVIAADLLPPDPVAQRFLKPVAAQVAYLPGDVRDPQWLLQCREARPDAIIHMATITPTPEVEAAMPDRVMAVNLTGTVNLLEVARAVGCQRFVYVSSSGVYGATADPVTPVLEEGPLQLGGLYAISKYASELTVRRYGELYGFSAASVRLGAPYGPMERPTGARQAMSAPYQLVHAALAGRRVTVGGVGIVRDWTFVADTARAIRALLEADQLHADCYNLSCGLGVRLQEIAEAIAEIVPGFEWAEAPATQADVAMFPANQRGPLDLTRLRADTGFEPRWSLRAGLEAYVAWLRDELTESR